MILDNEAIFSDAQAVATAVATPSTNILDLGKMGITGYQKAQLVRRMGVNEIPFLLQCVEGFTGLLTSMNFKIQSSVDEAFTVPENIISFDVPVAELIAGYRSPIKVLPRLIKKRYIRVLYTANNTSTAGKFTAAIVGSVEDNINS